MTKVQTKPEEMTKEQLEFYQKLHDELKSRQLGKCARCYGELNNHPAIRSNPFSAIGLEMVCYLCYTGYGIKRTI